MSRISALLVGEERLDRPLIQALEGAGMVVELADSVSYALAFAEVHQPDVIIATHIYDVHDGVELVAGMRRMSEGDGTAIVLVTEPGDVAARQSAWTAGADAVFPAPLDGAEMVACIGALVRQRRAALTSDAFRDDADRSVDELVVLILELLDVTVPGAAHRAEELAAGVNALALDFGIGLEQRHDLERAARLHELARITLGGKDVPAPGEGPGPSSRLTCATAALLRQVGALRGVAFLIDGMGAHWDGSGNPSEFQRGQIPMRSRLLRTVADLLAGARRLAASSPAPMVRAAEQLADHAGTWYDPAIVAAVLRHVSAERGGPWRTEDVEVTPVERLREGMVLAEDMYTASGVKLLAQHTVLSAALLELVRQRHLIDPIVLGVHIRTGRRG